MPTPSSKAASAARARWQNRSQRTESSLDGEHEETVIGDDYEPLQDEEIDCDIIIGAELLNFYSGDDSDEDDAAAVDGDEEENNDELLIMMQCGGSDLGVFAEGGESSAIPPHTQPANFIDELRAHSARLNLKKTPKPLKYGAGSASTDKRHAKRTKLFVAVGTPLPFSTMTAPPKDEKEIWVLNEEEEDKEICTVLPKLPVFEMDQIPAALERLALLICDSVNVRALKRFEKQNISPHDAERYKALRSYLIDVFASKPKMEASLEAARVVFSKGKYMAAKIRFWANLFVAGKPLPEHRQGKHRKTKSLIADEDVARIVLEEIRKYRCELISPMLLVKIVRDKFGITSRTAARWLGLLGYSLSDGKGLYFDGHEREDVVLYRHAYVERQILFGSRMDMYEELGGNLVAIPRAALNERQLIWVTQDECCFKANDGKRMVWLRKDGKRLLSKNPGRALMVSAFCCPCHGFMQLSAQELAENPEFMDRSVAIAYLNVGAQHDGYWIW